MKTYAIKRGENMGGKPGKPPRIRKCGNFFYTAPYTHNNNNPPLTNRDSFNLKGLK